MPEPEPSPMPLPPVGQEQAASVARLDRAGAYPAGLDIQGLVHLARSSGGVFSRCTELALQATSATTALVTLFRPGSGTLEVVAGAGHLGAQAVGIHALPGQALAWRVYGSQQALLLENPHEQRDASFVSGRPHPGVYLGVPLVDPDGATFGVLSVDTTETGVAFSEGDVQTLTLLAAAAGIAYARLASLEQAQALTERYALLAELTSRLEALTEVAEIRQAAQQAILPLSGFDTVTFYRLDSSGPAFVERTGRIQPEVVEALEAYVERPEAHALLARNMASRVPSLVTDYARYEDRDEGLVQSGVGSVLLLPVWNGPSSYGFWLVYTLHRMAALDESTLRLLGSLASRVERAIERTEGLGRLLQTREAALRGLGRVLESRDSETAGHTDRVTALAEQLGQRLGLPPEEMLHLRWGSYLHDVGKVAVSDALLRKPGPLTPPERLQMQGHVTIGDDLLRGEDFLPREVREIVRHHHERWDGNGYPDRLAGTAIPLLARAFSVVDVYDALTSVRPYKAAWSQDEAVRELKRAAGTQFDPEMVEVFVSQVLGR